LRGIKPMKLSFVTRPFQFGRAQHLGIGVLAYFPLGEETTLLTEMELWPEVMEVLGEVAPDLGIPKSRAEFLVVGSAHQPDAQPAPVRHVRARVGDMEKSLYVVGDRTWKDGVPTEPVPFVSMPITWDRAFGGEGFATNPTGKGFAKLKGPAGEKVHPLPNVELPGHMIKAEGDRPEPASFAPIDFMWPQRFSLAGTYDQKWLETRFPGFAEDMDWRIWNLAPNDQRREEPFRGDETVLLEHMHPSIPRLEGKLPGVRCICYVHQRTPDGLKFEEVPLKLTTIWLYPEIRRGLAVFHGAHPISEDDGDDIETILIAAERLGAPPRGTDHYRQVLERRTGENRAFEVFKETDLLPEDLGGFAPLAEQTAKTKHEGRRMERQRKGFEASIEEARASLVARGIDPDVHGPKGLAAPPAEPKFEELGEFAQQMLAEGARMRAEAEAESQKADERLKQLCEATGTDYEMILEEMRTPPGGPPKFTADGQREKMRALAERLAAEGNPVAELDYWATADEPYQQWKLAETQLWEAYRTTAHVRPPADAAPAEVSAAQRERVKNAVHAGTSLAGWDLTGIDLSLLELGGVNFEGAFLEAADLSLSTLDGANFKNAVLAHANLRDASATSADFTGANLGGADLEGASLMGSRLATAILSGTSFAGADLRGALLDESKFEGCRVERANFAGASLRKTFFHGVSFSEVVFGGADLEWITFIECNLSGVDLSECRLDNGTLFDTIADGARFTNASAKNLRVVGKVSLRETDFRGAKLDQATLREVCLVKADLSGASLFKADFSKADLTEAKLYRAVARSSTWIRACLRDAMMVSIDLFEAIVEKADLRGADLRGSNLYGADFALVRSDDRTTVEGAIQDRVRTLPRREAST
jgi:uncharacterized protein YjbI with pentapeptide repeats